MNFNLTLNALPLWKLEDVPSGTKQSSSNIYTLRGKRFRSLRFALIYNIDQQTIVIVTYLFLWQRVEQKLFDMNVKLMPREGKKFTNIR